MEVEDYLEAMRLIKLIDLTPEDYLDLSASHVLLYDEFIAVSYTHLTLPTKA